MQESPQPSQAGARAAQSTDRTFGSGTGLMFQPVKSERTADFERVIAYVQSALQTSADANVQKLAQGWRVFRAKEPGPNGTVLYVYVIDPTVPGADYALGPILAKAYPDKAEELWKLYRDSVTSGGTLMNLTPMSGAVMPDSKK